MTIWGMRVLLVYLLLLIAGPLPGSAMSLKIMCISDYQGEGKQEMLERISFQVIAAEGGIDALIVAGDYITSAEIFNLFNRKYGLGSSSQQLDIFIAPGNHDTEERLCGDDYFCDTLSLRYPLDRFQPSHRGTFFKYQIDDVLLIITNQFLPWRRKGYTRLQMDWIEGVLASSQYQHAFVVGHLPAFPAYRHVGESLDHYPVARDRFWDILSTHGAHYIHGHDEYFNLQYSNGSYQIDCGTVTSGYGSTVIIDIEDEELSFRFYELEQTGAGTIVSQSFAYRSAAEKNLNAMRPNNREQDVIPSLIWGSDRFPVSNPSALKSYAPEKKGRIESLGDWISYNLHIH